MTDDRRFDEREVAYILERATADAAADEAEQAALPASRGLSLAEIQEVATAVGLPAAAVERAAAAVARGDMTPTARRTLLGVPVGVSRSIALGRPITDMEWDRIVVELRETFTATGVVTRQGSIREWRNGNLRAILEPTPSGHRLRLSTLRSDAALLLRVGAVTATLGVIFATIYTVLGINDPKPWTAVAMLLGLGVFPVIRNALLLPGWARERAAQMEGLSVVIDRMLAERDGSHTLPPATPIG